MDLNRWSKRLWRLNQWLWHQPHLSWDPGSVDYKLCELEWICPNLIFLKCTAEVTAELPYVDVLMVKWVVLEECSAHCLEHSKWSINIYDYYYRSIWLHFSPVSVSSFTYSVISSIEYVPVLALCLLPNLTQEIKNTYEVKFMLLKISLSSLEMIHRPTKEWESHLRALCTQVWEQMSQGFHKHLAEVLRACVSGFFSYGTYHICQPLSVSSIFPQANDFP